MGYMERNLDKRTCPAKLLNGAKSVIVVGLNYKPPETDPPDLPGPVGRVANFARFEDYHVFIKKNLRKLAEFMCQTLDHEIDFKICVDSVPLAERALAVRAGLGFIGINHMLINPEFGSQLLLGEIVTSIELQADEPFEGCCSNCNKCVLACPTKAIGNDGMLDANKCISYLTIEHKTEIPVELTNKIGNRLFGCDECVMVCPYQEKAPARANKDFKFDPNRERIELSKIMTMTDQQFAEVFTDTCIERLGLTRLKRNAQICLENS
jgi:epoxyqueuosine reductase